MNKTLAVCFAALTMTGAAFAQPAETAPQAAVQVTTATAANAAGTTNPASRLFTQEQFDKRWEMESRMYKDAGISEEKIQRLHDLNARIWKARSEGQTADFQAIMKERAEILTQEEVEKIRELRRKEIDKQLGERGQMTTATKAATRNTTMTAPAVQAAPAPAE